RFCPRYRYGSNKLFLGEIFIVEDIGGGADQLEAHFQIALIAHRKQVVAIHDCFMRRAMAFIVDDFIDSTLQYRLSWQKDLVMLAGFAMAPIFVSARHQYPVDFLA